MSRPHPFDMVFGLAADELFAELHREAGDGLLDTPTFARLPSTEAILKRLGNPEIAEADASALEEYIRLLLVAFFYWRHGARTLRPARSSLEPLLDGAAPPAPVQPIPAAYLELPQHWIWAQIDEAAPHEPVEGIFVARVDEGTTIVAVLGLREERGGFSQISAVATQEDFEAAREAVRALPFAPTMPGGLEAGFRTIVSEAELIRLTHLAMLSVPQ